MVEVRIEDMISRFCMADLICIWFSYSAFVFGSLIQLLYLVLLFSYSFSDSFVPIL